MSGWTKFRKGVVGVLGGDIFNGKDSLVSRYANDFKDWFDGTAAQRKANQMNIENWNLQNAYNTPEAQMARYAAAGLNPNLIYSQQNTAGSIASVSPAQSGSETLGKAAQMLSSFYNIAGLIANVHNLQQQNKNLQTQDTLLSAQADYVDAQAQRYRYETNWLRGHGTSSFDDPKIRAGKSMFDYTRPYLEKFSDFLGSTYGHMTGEGKFVTLIRSRFHSQSELMDVARSYSDKGYVVYFSD